MLTYQVESWQQYINDCSHLWLEHYEEIAVQKDKMAMKPYDKLYRQLENEGCLHVLTIRCDGKMIGYHISFVRPHAHYSDVLCAYVDAYFVSASHRKGMTGVKMIKEAEKTLGNRGVKKMFSGTKNSKDIGKVFEFLGWTPTEQLYSKWIGD